MKVKKNAAILLLCFLGVAPMIGFDLVMMHYFGKEATPFMRGGNLAYAFLILKPFIHLGRRLAAFQLTK